MSILFSGHIVVMQLIRALSSCDEMRFIDYNAGQRVKQPFACAPGEKPRPVLYMKRGSGVGGFVLGRDTEPRVSPGGSPIGLSVCVRGQSRL